MADHPASDFAREFLDAVDSLEAPFEELLEEHRPDCIVSDQCYPWSADVALAHGIPRLTFRGGNIFTLLASAAIARFKPHEDLADDEQFIVPGIPHRVKMSKCQIPSLEPCSPLHDLMSKVAGANSRSYGRVVNTAYELEPGYTKAFDIKTWLVGPLSLGARDGSGRHDIHECLNWLDSKKPGSVIYMCFGSMAAFTDTQLQEMAAGLEASGHPYLWVVRDTRDMSESMPPEETENGMIIRGWAPQLAILDHAAVGGFVTHCGWNSCLEGASHGVPMVTWPLTSDQFFNERLLVNVLRIGVAVGSNISNIKAEERTLVAREEVARAVREVMGSGAEAEERRWRAVEAAEVSRKAVERGGSSYNDIDNLILELTHVKLLKAKV